MDHVAKPYMSLGEEAGLRGWAEDMRAAAQHRSVWCGGWSLTAYCTVNSVNADIFLFLFNSMDPCCYARLSVLQIL